MIALPPDLGERLTRAVQIPDMETALWKMLSDYLELKIAALKMQITQLEEKWQMPFEEFAAQCKEQTLAADPYSWEVEQDFWKWEKAVTLLEHYEALRV